MGNAGVVADERAGRADGGPAAAPMKHSLALLERGSFMELPRDVFNDFTDATVEAWVKWNTVGLTTRRLFNYGGAWRDFSILSEPTNATSSSSWSISQAI
jgi:hypothetical protein